MYSVFVSQIMGRPGGIIDLTAWHKKCKYTPGCKESSIDWTLNIEHSYLVTHDHNNTLYITSLHSFYTLLQLFKEECLLTSPKTFFWSSLLSIVLTDNKSLVNLILAASYDRGPYIDDQVTPNNDHWADQTRQDQNYYYSDIIQLWQWK